MVIIFDGWFQASWYVQNLLYSLCREINRVGGHAVQRWTNDSIFSFFTCKSKVKREIHVNRKINIYCWSNTIRKKSGFCSSPCNYEFTRFIWLTIFKSIFDVAMLQLSFRGTLHQLVSKVTDEVMKSFEEVVSNSRKKDSNCLPLTQQRALQLIFDVKFILQIIPRKDDTVVSRSLHPVLLNMPWCNWLCL